MEAEIEDRLDDLTFTEIGALANLAVAGLEGNHIVVCGFSLAKRLSQYTGFGLRERTYFKRFLVEYSSMAPIVDGVSYHLRIAVNALEGRFNIDENRSASTVSLRHFALADSVGPTKLVGEDLRDCNWIQSATLAFMKVSAFRRLRLSLELVGGGGDNTALVLENIYRNQQRPVICVVDSDQKPSSWRLGDTARKVRDFAVANPSFRLFYHLLNCHELENLIPDEVFEGLIPDVHIVCPQTGRRIGRFANEGFDLVRLHIDIKKGLTLKDVLRCADDAGSRAVWSPFADAILNETIEIEEAWASCASSSRCASPDECKCLILRPLGGGLLEQVDEAWRRHGPKMWHQLPSYLKTVLAELCSIVVAWGCAMPRRIA